MTNRNKTILLVVIVAAAAAIGCGAGTLVALQMREKIHSGGSHGYEHDTHDHVSWHKQLKLSRDQALPMASIESQFGARQYQLIKNIRSANVELASALKRDRSFSTDVQLAVEKIHRAQAALQTATIEHLVDMGTVLTPEQFLDQACDALTHD